MEHRKPEVWKFISYKLKVSCQQSNGGTLWVDDFPLSLGVGYLPVRVIFKIFSSLFQKLINAGNLPRG